MNESDTGTSIRIILDGNHRTRNSTLVPPEINQTVRSLGPTSTMKSRNASPIISPPLLGIPNNQRLLRSRASQFRKVRRRHLTDGWRSWLVTFYAHILYLAPAKNSILSPSFKETIAFFQSGVFPRLRPNILDRPETFMVVTFVTETLNKVSTAFRISPLAASFRSSKKYSFAVVCFCVDF